MVTPDGGTLSDFQTWALGDLRSNALRGIFAEWLVARAVGADTTSPRDAWANYDVLTPSGTTVEVKPGAYVQAWSTIPSSQIVYSGLTGREWLPDNTYSPERRVRADVFVFALHTATDPERYDATDLAQWEWRVCAGSLIERLGQRSIRLPRLVALGVPVSTFAGLAELVEQVASAR